ncbi:hypothetical protein [Nostoc sp. UHCC 0870]|uniref:hypothetical protein n=1 Tax=Nostoc sp. UHCC 0870 TaxID=2914041 RepID=UPI001EDCC005|nr:hypothetical protein [Nostoc sp. UHCC 0870]UKO96260.1 hypothetical protein L6494_16620 [Nostoc sp. UHCC 0870]
MGHLVALLCSSASLSPFQIFLNFAKSSVGGFPAVGTPLATSRETRPTQWLNFSRRILNFELIRPQSLLIIKVCFILLVLLLPPEDRI